MFVIDTTINDRNVKEGGLYKVIFSVNIHEVATPELTTENAKSYIFISRDGGKFRAYIGLYFPQTDRRLYYRYEANPFSENELSGVEDEARNFAQDMGAMLDELDISKMSGVETERWIEEQDIFSERIPDPSRGAAPAEQTPPTEQPELLSRKTATPSPDPPPTPNNPDVNVHPAQASRPPTATQPEEPPASADQPEVEPEPRTEPKSKTAPVVRPQVRTPGLPKTSTVLRTSKREAIVPTAKGAIDQALKGNTVLAGKQPVSKENGESSGVAGREKEALARLLASF